MGPASAFGAGCGCDDDQLCMTGKGVTLRPEFFAICMFPVFCVDFMCCSIPIPVLRTCVMAILFVVTELMEMRMCGVCN